MNTPAHILIGWAAMARNRDRKIVLAAVFGALLPDLSLYLLAGVSLFILNIPPGVVFGQLYFSPAWQAVFSVDNSFIVYGAILAFGFWKRNDWVIALAGAALLHLLLDLPLHHDDGRAHFWPLSGWIYESPLSYWDRGHHANVVAPIAATLSAICGWLIVKDDLKSWRTGVVGLLVGLEIFGAAFLFGP